MNYLFILKSVLDHFQRQINFEKDRKANFVSSKRILNFHFCDFFLSCSRPRECCRNLKCYAYVFFSTIHLICSHGVCEQTFEKVRCAVNAYVQWHYLQTNKRPSELAMHTNQICAENRNRSQCQLLKARLNEAFLN